MPRVQLPITHLDSIHATGSGISARPDLINLDPEPNEIDVPIDTPIEIKIVDVGVHGLASNTRVDVTSNSGTITAFLQGTGFHSSYAANSSFIVQASPNAGTNDEHLIQLIRNTPYLSEENITVHVTANTTDGKFLDRTYVFTVEDTTLPALLSARSNGLTNIVVSFSEPVSMSTGINGVLRVREVSGRITPTAPNFFEIEKANFTQDSIGDFLSFTGFEPEPNNSYFTIRNIIDTKTVQVVEQTISTADPDINTEGWIGPYKLEAVMEPEHLIPTFIPSIVGVTQLDTSTVQLILDQELSPNRPYKLTIVNFNDLSVPANKQPSSFVTFVSEPMQTYVNRSFNLWDMMPDFNKQQDTFGDAQRFIRCCDEVTQLLLHEVDRFSVLNDVDLSPSEALDAQLSSLGNTFTFLDTETIKRRTIQNLIKIFKDGGIDRGIESAVKFFLSLDVSVEPFHLLDGWILGESELDIDTILGTDVKFLVYSFQIVSDVSLTQQQRDIITEIANTLKPAHTHFVRFIEP